MEKRKYKKDEMWYDKLEWDGKYTIGQYIANLKSIAKDLKARGWINLRCDKDYDAIFIAGERPETDKEMNERIKRENKINKKKRAKEAEQLAEAIKLVKSNGLKVVKK